VIAEDKAPHAVLHKLCLVEGDRNSPGSVVGLMGTVRALAAGVVHPVAHGIVLVLVVVVALVNRLVSCSCV